MERRSADVKVLWSNLHRGVRTFIISYVKPKETPFSYRLLATISKHVKDLSALREEDTKLFIKIRTHRRPTRRELAFSPIPLTLNIIGRAVLKNPGYAVLTAAIEGFRKPDLAAASLTLSKDEYTDYVRPVIISSSPDVSEKSMKRHASDIARRVWGHVRSTLASIDGRFEELEDITLLPPIALIAVMGKASAVEEIKAVIADGGEYREIKVPVRRPEWRITDLPTQIIEDIKTSIVDPIKAGMPFAAKGALLTGPPGVGKSVMAEALADALGLNVVELRPQTYRSMWYGATEKALNAIFKQIIRKRREIALIIDDAEFISSRKYTMHEAHISEISTILYHLQRPDRPFTILTANNPELIDPAILRPGRIDVAVVMGYPDRSMRRKAILRNAERYRITFKPEGMVEELVSATKWFTLAEVDALLRLAASKGRGVVGRGELEWGKRKFNVNVSERVSMQDYLRWWARKTQGIVITYIPSETEI
ncbi:MAG: ATP-binding protein [Desulfurococcales archaeon]|nr:ATP-binding protein [Desulfurococcales archaeon]